MKKMERMEHGRVHGRGKKLPKWVIEEKLKRLTVRPKVMGVPATPASCMRMCTFMYMYSIEDLFNEDADAREEDMKFIKKKMKNTC